MDSEIIGSAAAPNKLRGKFFKDEARDYVEISIIGDPNTLVRKVSPQDVAMFPADWQAYQSGNKEIEVAGLPLTEVPGVDRNVALALKLKGVRVAEELANLDEAAAKGLGMGGLTIWKAAQNLIKLRQLEAQAAKTRPADVAAAQKPRT